MACSFWVSTVDRPVDKQDAHASKGALKVYQRVSGARKRPVSRILADSAIRKRLALK